jgi:hypothetical protein
MHTNVTQQCMQHKEVACTAPTVAVSLGPSGRQVAAVAACLLTISVIILLSNQRLHTDAKSTSHLHPPSALTYVTVFDIHYEPWLCFPLQGAYRDDSGQPVVLHSVREAERRVAGSHFMEYLPIAGEGVSE